MGGVIAQISELNYLGSILQKDEEINEDVLHRIPLRWLK